MTSKPARSRIRREAEKMIAGVPELPPPLLRALCTLADDQESFQAIRSLLDDTDELRRKILRIANSPIYAPQNPIETPEHAAVMLGRQKFNMIVISSALQPYFDRFCYGYTASGLWLHSIAVATSAWSIAEELDVAVESGSQIYVAGLVHDIGKVVLTDLLRQRGEQIDLERTPDEPPGLVELERETLGICHVEAGVLLAERWNLEPAVVRLVESHHLPDGSADPDAAILHLTDYLLASLGVGYRENTPVETPLVPSALDQLIDSPDFLPLCEQIALRESARSLAIVEALV